VGRAGRLNFSKMEAGRMTLEAVPLDATVLGEDIVRR
jgi:hypothetical protein